MVKIKFYILLLLIPFFACEKEVKWDLATENETRISVESIITNENKFQEVKIFRTSNRLNDNIIPILSADVMVSDGEKNFHFSADSAQTGIYFSDEKFIGVVSKRYSLTVTYSQKKYVAHTEMLPINASDTLVIAEDQTSHFFYISTPAEGFDTKDAAFWVVSANWATVSGYENLSLQQTSSKQYFYKFRTVDVNQIFSPLREIVFFPKGTKIISKKYSVTPAFEAFLRGVIYETSWSGGFFDAEHGTPQGNISNGAFGFFAACSVIKKTITVE